MNLFFLLLNIALLLLDARNLVKLFDFPVIYPFWLKFGALVIFAFHILLIGFYLFKILCSSCD